MGEKLERILSVLVGVATLIVATLLVGREFYGSGAPTSNNGKAEYVKQWRSALPAGRFKGDTSGRILIVEFADLECPFCRLYHETLRDVEHEYGKEVSVVFVHFPLDMHRFARPAAFAAECAGKQNQFSAYVDIVYQKQDSLGLKDWTSYAADAGIVDTAGFRACIVDVEHLPAVSAGTDAGEKLNVSGTPTIFVHGWRYPSPPKLEELQRAIDALRRGETPF